jgi:hypothetical protein
MESEATEIWREILRLDNNFMLSYVGIGKSLLAEGNNREAMLYLRTGNDLRHYSIAYRRYRNDVLNDNLPVVLSILFSAIIITAVARTALKIVRKRKERGMKV